MMKYRRLRWEENVARMGQRMNAYGTFMGNPEGNIALRGTKRI
jgi:hypothetical protein